MCEREINKSKEQKDGFMWGKSVKKGMYKLLYTAYQKKKKIVIYMCYMLMLIIYVIN